MGGLLPVLCVEFRVQCTVLTTVMWSLFCIWCSRTIFRINFLTVIYIFSIFMIYTCLPLFIYGIYTSYRKEIIIVSHFLHEVLTKITNYITNRCPQVATVCIVSHSLISHHQPSSAINHLAFIWPIAWFGLFGQSSV